MLYVKESTSCQPISSKSVIHKEERLHFSIPKGTAVTKTFNFPTMLGYSRYMIIKHIAGTGSDAAITNTKLDSSKNLPAVTVCHIWMNAEIDVLAGCIYVPDPL